MIAAATADQNQRSSDTTEKKQFLALTIIAEWLDQWSDENKEIISVSVQLISSR